MTDRAALAAETRLLAPMGEADLDAVLAIETAAAAFPWLRGHFADSLKAGYSGWVLRLGGEIVGFAMVMAAVDEAHLLNIAVAPALHRRGLGRWLLIKVMDAARQAGLFSMLLEVRPSNLGAVALYQDLGFVEIGRRKGYYPAADGREDAIVMQRALVETQA
ncbi:ribosomal-protein-alanine acetyltransferase [Oryzomicrobium terrae]|uniref:[Ribosomal protein bS18]-alanine N-acetyltransferase n=1 Tax=Oryzomicrobium terrae TaxID=1735038 RepID=A0A5C1E7H6_9RHOO|nr:ribosomal protein S18-alanine N-acetyltransferase [Oryzomicrobium terrae]QEL64906.1 ribosomal-protein-alanine acetyltransferase [Oryzomicrobium terrae]